MAFLVQTEKKEFALSLKDSGDIEDTRNLGEQVAKDDRYIKRRRCFSVRQSRLTRGRSDPRSVLIKVSEVAEESRQERES